jgi:hypothetical protein
VKVRLILLMAALTQACSADAAPRLDQPGDPCRGDEHRCVDEHTVTRCANDIIVETDCDDVCAELGPAWSADGCDDQCICVPADPSGCWPGTTNCVNEQTLEQCSDNQIWEAIDCDELCAAAGRSSVGCAEQADELTGDPTADCWCSGEGTPCDPATSPTCVDETSLASCEDGSWVFQDCAEICGAPSPCVPWQTPASCSC